MHHLDKVYFMKLFAHLFALFLFGVMACGCRSTAEEAPDQAFVDADTTVTRIAFGSCLKNPSGGAILDQVVAYKPDLFVWLGDNVYIDTNDKPERFKQRYDALGANPRFQQLNQACRNLATWDDHDYGNNDIGMRYPLKTQSKEQFGAFWKIPRSEPFWKREGIYRAYEYGPRDKRVQVILLDGRWFRDLKNADQADSYLGKAQWAWLEQVLGRPAKVRLICSGLQVIRVNDNGWEMVGQHPSERQRLFDLVEQTRANGVVFISGDTHFSEIHRTTKTKYHLYDVTSSGMDTVWNTVGKSKDTGDFEKVGESYRAENFGSITIDWGSKTKIFLQVRDNQGKIRIEQKVDLDELKVP